MTQIIVNKWLSLVRFWSFMNGTHWIYNDRPIIKSKGVKKPETKPSQVIIISLSDLDQIKEVINQ